MRVGGVGLGRPWPARGWSAPALVHSNGRYGSLWSCLEISGVPSCHAPEVTSPFLGRVGVGWLGQHSVPACWGFEATQLLGVCSCPSQTWVCPRVASQEARAGWAGTWGPGLEPQLCVCLAEPGFLHLRSETFRQEPGLDCSANWAWGLGAGSCEQEGLSSGHTAWRGPRDPPHGTSHTVPAAAPGSGGGSGSIPWLLLRHARGGLRSCWGKRQDLGF